VNFEFDKSDIDSASSVVLDAAADQLNECRNVAVRVGEHGLVGTVCTTGAVGGGRGVWAT
jgi:hypothetical protein